MPKNNKAAWAIAALVAGLAFAPAAWSAGDQTQTPAKRHHVRQSQIRQTPPAVPQNSCDYDRAAGRCMIDLGNGRCMECSAGPAN